MSKTIYEYNPLTEKLKAMGKKGMAGVVMMVGGLILLLLLSAVIGSAVFITKTYETVIVTRFGKIERVITEPGVNWKVPMVDTVNRVDMRVRPWDGPAAEMPTLDKKYIVVDSFARWEVADPELFYTKFLTGERARSRITDIVNSETRTEVGLNNLVEVIRNTKGREPVFPDGLNEDERTSFTPIINGRSEIEQRITKRAEDKLSDLGVRLLGFYLKRVNYSRDVQNTIEQRMISERERIASRLRAEGAEEASKIDGRRERELRQIESEAFKRSEEIRGEAEREAYEIYNKAYAATPEHTKFYSFLKRMDSYEESLAGSVFFLKMENPYLSALRGSVESVAADAGEAK